MRKTNPILILLLFMIWPALSSFANSPAKAANTTTRIERKPFSIVVPEGWYYSVLDGKSPASDGEILATPFENMSSSPVFLSIRRVGPDFGKHVASAEKTKTWNGRLWKLSVSPSTVRKSEASPAEERTNWMALTPVRGGQIAILAGAPAKDAEKYRPMIEKAMASAVVGAP